MNISIEFALEDLNIDGMNNNNPKKQQNAHKKGFRKKKLAATNVQQNMCAEDDRHLNDMSK